MNGDFLPRAHSKRLGELERSNWKILEEESDLGRIDPAIREIISLLNEKGYRTFSSCSGGHKTNPRWRVNRHESGYIAFSPPSNIAFTLYLALRNNQNFTVEAQAVIDNGEGGDRETICTRLYWQLADSRKAKQIYYRKLFSQMQEIISSIPSGQVDGKEVLSGLLGKRQVNTGLKIVKRQMRRFNNS